MFIHGRKKRKTGAPDRFAKFSLGKAAAVLMDRLCAALMQSINVQK
jgi:hypothetical protein